MSQHPKPGKRLLTSLLLIIGIAMCACAQGVASQYYFATGKSAFDVSPTQLTQHQVDSLKTLAAEGQPITVTGMASPEGSTKANQRLALRRAKAVVADLCRQTGLPATAFQPVAKVMDWDVLRTMVQQDEATPDREAVLQLLAAHATPATAEEPTAGGSSLTSEQLSTRLRQLSGGTPYLYIKQHFLPLMRSSQSGTADDAPQQAIDAAKRGEGLKLFQAIAAKQPKPATAAPVPAAEAAQKADQAKQVPAQAKQSPEQSKSVESPAPATKTDTTEAQTSTAYQQPAAEPATATGKALWIIITLVLAALAALAAWFLARKKSADLRERIAELKSENDTLQQQANTLRGELHKSKVQLSTKEQELSKAKQAVEDSEKLLQKTKDEAARNLDKLTQAEGELNKVKTEMAEVKDSASKQYTEGSVLYQYLKDGGSTSKWNNEQTRALIEHYRLINQPLIHTLETDYDSLSPNNILFEILLDMGKTDAEIQQIMNISQTTIRSIRFRIKAKKR